jgi:hypothetical protein
VPEAVAADARGRPKKTPAPFTAAGSPVERALRGLHPIVASGGGDGEKKNGGRANGTGPWGHTPTNWTWTQLTMEFLQVASMSTAQ